MTQSSNRGEPEAAQITIAAWNLEGRLSQFHQPGEYRGSPRHIIRGIESLDNAGVDLLFMPEAFDAERGMSLGAQSEVAATFRGRNHFEVRTSYDEDHSDRLFAATGEPHMMAMGRVAVRRFEPLRLGDIRTMMDMTVAVPNSSEELRIIGVHLDDRREANRIRQFLELADLLGPHPERTVVMGDFNTTTGESLTAKLMSSFAVRSLAGAIPSARIRDMASRMSDMGHGAGLQAFSTLTGMRRATAKETPTITLKTRGMEWMPAGTGLVAIDHLYVSPDITVEDFTVRTDDMGSDHRAISATLSLC